MGKRRCDRRGLWLSDAGQANAKVVGAMAKRKCQKTASVPKHMPTAAQTNSLPTMAPLHRRFDSN